MSKVICPEPGSQMTIGSVTAPIIEQGMSEPTPSNDGLPAGMELGTVYLFPFRGGSGTLYEFVSAVSYHELERTLAAQRAALLYCYEKLQPMQPFEEWVKEIGK